MQKRFVIQAALLFALTQPGWAQSDIQWLEGASYDDSIPTPREVLGYEIGEDFTEHLRMTQYMRLLEQASDRVRVFRVGESIERRELLLVAISSAENMTRLEEIRERVAELRDPRKTSLGRAREIAASTPAVSWMNFANDGNESAAFEAGIRMAYQLAAGTDPTTLKILTESIVVIYPAHNPESHSRYVAWMKASATGSPDPQAQEHRRDWRMDTNNNHYQIDLNRDAVFLSQVESRVIVSQIHRWNPVVFVDFHGNPDRFFFPPWAVPVNTHLDDRARHWVNVYGRNIADAFDRQGWAYFTHNVFDLHYPGYYDSYPSLNGATGMTFETDGGGNKGLAYRLPDGRITTFLDGILHHFAAGMATLLTTAESRQERLLDFYRFRSSGLEEARREPVKQYVLVPGPDPVPAADLAHLLELHGIEVQRAGRAFSSRAAHDYFGGEATARDFPAGAYVIKTAQPQKRLLRTLLDRESPLEEEFLEQARRNQAYNESVGERAPKKRLGFYDITAWSLPLAYGVESYWTEDEYSGPVQEARPEAGPAEPRRARFAYLFPWNSRAATRVVNALWDLDHQVSLATESFLIDGTRFPAGTVVVRQQSNSPELHANLSRLALQEGLNVTPVDSAWVTEGWDLGDRSVVDLKAPSIAVITEEPTRVTAYGAIWFLLEQTYRIPFTPLKAADLAGSDLSRYDVLVLPDGSAAGYGRHWGEETVERLRNWVREGGSLVCIKGAAEWAARKNVDLTSARVRDRTREEKGEGKSEEEAKGRRLPPVPGALLRLEVDTRHYLGLGVDGPVTVLLRSDHVFEPTSQGARVAEFPKENAIVAGFTFEASRPALAGAPFLWDEPVGQGHVICFADDVTFRTFLQGAHRLFLNSLLLPASSGW